MFETYLLILVIVLGFISSFMLGYIYVDEPGSYRTMAFCAVLMSVSVWSVMAMMESSFARVGGAALICVVIGVIEGWKERGKVRLH